jgi:hypothetical protein
MNPNRLAGLVNHIFLKMGVSHGFLMLGSMEFMMKLKKALRLE